LCAFRMMPNSPRLVGRCPALSMEGTAPA
jgi:hypothetical protein